ARPGVVSQLQGLVVRVQPGERQLLFTVAGLLGQRGAALAAAVPGTQRRPGPCRRRAADVTDRLGIRIMRRPSMCLLVALLSGCAGHGPDTQRVAGDEHAVPLPEPLQPLFGRPGTAQQALGESPWGSGVTIVLQDI